MKSSSGYLQLYALRPGVKLATDGKGGNGFRLLRTGYWRTAESFQDCNAGHRLVVQQLAKAPSSAAQLRELANSAGEDVDVTAFITRLRAGGWLTITVRSADQDLYTILPVRELSGTPEDTGFGLVLSRFAVLRADGDRILVESPLAQANVTVHDPAITALLGALVSPLSPEVASQAVPLPADVTDRVLRDLRWAGLLVAPRAENASPWQHWSPHELWFHSRSRRGNGGHFSGFGLTNWGSGLGEAVQARRQPFDGDATALYQPDLAALREKDKSFTEVLEDRCSKSAHDDANPITAEQLGEFLYRSSRIRDSFMYDGVERFSAPRPSGGSVYELELYTVVRKVSGLVQGVYHYDAHDHLLRLACRPNAQHLELLRTAGEGAGSRRPPQVLIVITARFGRLMRIYEEIPYSLVLKHVGALYQTMYLVATSMDLAACALGAGDPAAFSDATGVDFAEEGSVGEFIVGSMADE